MILLATTLFPAKKFHLLASVASMLSSNTFLLAPKPVLGNEIFKSTTFSGCFISLVSKITLFSPSFKLTRTNRTPLASSIFTCKGSFRFHSTSFSRVIVGLSRSKSAALNTYATTPTIISNKTPILNATVDFPCLLILDVSFLFFLKFHHAMLWDHTQEPQNQQLFYVRRLDTPMQFWRR